MKIIDILNKIANGEEVPNKIKFHDLEFKFRNKGYYCELEDKFEPLGSIYILDLMLKDKVEVIEEDKKIPEKLEKYYDENLEEYVVETYINGVNYKEIFNSKYDEMIISKLNEVLDYLKSKGE